MSAYRNLRLELKSSFFTEREYNIIQRVLYICVIWIVIALVVSEWRYGSRAIPDLDRFSRRLRAGAARSFFAMLGLVAFLAIHVGALWLSRNDAVDVYGTPGEERARSRKKAMSLTIVAKGFPGSVSAAS